MEALFIAVGLFVPVAGIAGYLLWRGRRRLGRVRRLLGQARPTSANAGPLLAGGPTLVARWGKCRAGELLRAPLSGEEVCGYRVRILALKHLPSTLWGSEQILMDRTRIADFVLEDDSGELDVRTQDAVLLGDDRHYGDTGLFLKGDPPHAVTSYLEAFGHSSIDGLRMGSKLCWYEYHIKPGEPVLVIGSMTSGERPALEAPPDGKLIVADRGYQELLDAIDELDLPPDLLPGGS